MGLLFPPVWNFKAAIRHLSPLNPNSSLFVFPINPAALSFGTFPQRHLRYFSEIGYFVWPLFSSQEGPYGTDIFHYDFFNLWIPFSVFVSGMDKSYRVVDDTRVSKPYMIFLNKSNIEGMFCIFIWIDLVEIRINLRKPFEVGICLWKCSLLKWAFAYGSVAF